MISSCRVAQVHTQWQAYKYTASHSSNNVYKALVSRKCCPIYCWREPEHFYHLSVEGVPKMHYPIPPRCLLSISECVESIVSGLPAGGTYRTPIRGKRYSLFERALWSLIRMKEYFREHAWDPWDAHDLRWRLWSSQNTLYKILWETIPLAGDSDSSPS